MKRVPVGGCPLLTAISPRVFSSSRGLQMHNLFAGDIHFKALKTNTDFQGSCDEVKKGAAYTLRQRVVQAA